MSKQLIVLLSRQRSGTNAFRAVIDSHAGINCYEEVLNPDQHYLEHAWSYFNFIQANCSAKDLHPSNHLNLFTSFVEHLHELHDKPRTLVDLKYNTCSHISANWRPMTGGSAMPLFNWIKANDVPVIRLRRDNYLRVALSNEIAIQRQKWHDRPGEKISTKIVSLKMEGASGWYQPMKAWQLEDQQINEQFAGYNNLLTFEYSELYPHLDRPICPQALENFARLLEIPNDFSTDTWCKKSTRQPIWESISNWHEVADFLCNTEFASFLDDEPMYRGETEVVAADAKRIILQTANSLLRRIAG